MLYSGSQSFGPCVWCSIVVENDGQAESSVSIKNKETLAKEVKLHKLYLDSFLISHHSIAIFKDTMYSFC